MNIMVLYEQDQNIHKNHKIRAMLGHFTQMLMEFFKFYFLIFTLTNYLRAAMAQNWWSRIRVTYNSQVVPLLCDQLIKKIRGE